LGDSPLSLEQMIDTTIPIRRCTECGAPQHQERRTVDYPESGLTNVELFNVPVWVCPNHHDEVEIPAVTQLHELLAHLIIRKPANLTGGEIKFLRRRVGIQAKEFAQRIGLTPVSLSRFENEQRPVSRKIDLLIKLSAAALIAARDNKPFPADLAPLVRTLEAWDIGRHRLRHVDAAVPEHEWEPTESEPSAALCGT
jgi:putative zinc finger/helix-turn-helix YgiT family protein